MRIPFKKDLLGELLDDASKLEGQAASHITPKVISVVADSVEAVENMGLRVD